MSGPSSAPRGEQPGAHGPRWEPAKSVSLGEVFSLDDGDDPEFGWLEPKPGERASRAVRRRAAREARRTTTGTSNAPFGPQTGSGGLDSQEASN